MSKRSAPSTIVPALAVLPSLTVDIIRSGPTYQKWRLSNGLEGIFCVECQHATFARQDIQPVYCPCCGRCHLIPESRDAPPPPRRCVHEPPLVESP